MRGSVGPQQAPGTASRGGKSAPTVTSRQLSKAVLRESSLAVAVAMSYVARVLVRRVPAVGA
ncbi:hypothetical protein [Streptomyces sp. NPDC051572]|uniref:hypothetical protein n=1 Tax=Streptomyces sp. NPDC051572 TaxID=3155802 RepID=UPI00344B1312